MPADGDLYEQLMRLGIFGGFGLKRILEAIDQANDYRLFKQPFPVEVFEVESGTV